MKRIPLLCLVIAITSILFTGCVKVVRLDDPTKGGSVEAQFDPTSYVEKNWDSKMIPELEKKAADLTTVLKEANGNLSSVGSKYAKVAKGQGNDLNFIVKGTGVVQEVNTESRAGFLVIKLDGYSGQTVVKVQIGPVIIGTSTRDSLDMIKFEDFKNQVVFGSLSKAINEKITSSVIKEVDTASLKGKTVEFYGTFTLNSNKEILIAPVKLAAK